MTEKRDSANTKPSAPLHPCETRVCLLATMEIFLCPELGMNAGHLSGGPECYHWVNYTYNVLPHSGCVSFYINLIALTFD